MRAKLMIAALAALVSTSSAHAATVLWTFDGGNTGSGTLSYDDVTDVVTDFSGSYANQRLSLVTFTTDPNNPNAEIGSVGNGRYTYRGVPNTGGVNYTFDGLFHQTYDNAGYLVSTGIGSDERVYVLNVDRNNGVDQFNFFSVNPNGSYQQDFGIFSTTAVSTPGAVPEPASWALMIVGVGLAGGAVRRRRAAQVRPFYAA